MELTRKSFIDKKICKQKRHQPMHLYLDNAYYFITSHTYKSNVVLKASEIKSLLLEKIRFWFKEFKYKLFAWVILDNHYHLLGKSLRGIDLPKIISKIHAGFSYEINKLENNQGRKIWQNYWDKCIRSEREFWMHFNYVHHNPVKHGYVKKMDSYEFSSFRYWLEKKGEEWIIDMFRNYPIVDFTLKNDE